MTPQAGTTQLSVRVSISYPGRLNVLSGATLDIGRGEIVGLAGESGSGKSSFALALMRLLHLKGGNVSGEIRLGGRDLMRLTEAEMRRVRGREMALVPQSPMSFLNPAMRLWDQMAEAWRAHGAGSRPIMERQIVDAIRLVGLPAGQEFLRRRPDEVSVGQAQRVLIAMAVLHRPALLIADEPTSSLDVISQAEILRLFAKLNRETGASCLYISHDLQTVASLCHRVAILHHGSIVEFDFADRVFNEPSHPYTRMLIEAMPKPPARRPAPLIPSGALPY